MAPRILTPGTMLSGRYQVGDVVGESDLSIVYAATDSRNSAPVALKVFDANVKARAAALSEYQSQARQASAGTAMRCSYSSSTKADARGQRRPDAGSMTWTNRPCLRHATTKWRTPPGCLTTAIAGSTSLDVAST